MLDNDIDYSKLKCLPTTLCDKIKFREGKCDH